MSNKAKLGTNRDVRDFIRELRKTCPHYPETLTRVAFALVQKPDLRVKHIATNSHRSVNVTLELLEIMMSQDFKALMGADRSFEIEMYNKACFNLNYPGRNTREWTFESAAWDSSGAGGRADLLLVDDILPHLHTDQEREDYRSTYANVWIPLLAKDGRVEKMSPRTLAESTI